MSRAQESSGSTLFCSLCHTQTESSFSKRNRTQKKKTCVLPWTVDIESLADGETVPYRREYVCATCLTITIRVGGTSKRVDDVTLHLGTVASSGPKPAVLEDIPSDGDSVREECIRIWTDVGAKLVMYNIAHHTHPPAVRLGRMKCMLGHAMQELEAVVAGAFPKRKGQVAYFESRVYKGKPAPLRFAVFDYDVLMLRKIV